MISLTAHVIVMHHTFYVFCYNLNNRLLVILKLKETPLMNALKKHQCFILMIDFIFADQRFAE